MKKVKSRLFVAVVAVLAVLIVANLVLLAVGLASPAKNIQRRWNVALPQNRTLKYFKSNVGWFGEGERYTVFELRGEAVDFFADFVDNLDSVKDVVGQIIARLEVKTKFLPDWEKNFQVRLVGEVTYAHMCMVWFPETKILIVCEEIF